MHLAVLEMSAKPTRDAYRLEMHLAVLEMSLTRLETSSDQASAASISSEQREHIERATRAYRANEASISIFLVFCGSYGRNELLLQLASGIIQRFKNFFVDFPFRKSSINQYSVS